jgi:hypothetical protein
MYVFSRLEVLKPPIAVCRLHKPQASVAGNGIAILKKLREGLEILIKPQSPPI